MTPDIDIAADRAVIDAATRRAGQWAALGTRLLEDTGGCTCGPGGLNGLHEPYCGAEPVAEGSPDVIAFAVAARTGWPRALDALEAAQEGNDRLGAMVEWLAEVIVDARDACQRAESIEPSGSPEWVESGIAMRTTALREVRAILDRERNAHPFGLSAHSAVAGNRELAERAEVAGLREALDEAIRHKVELHDLWQQAKAERNEARAEVEAMRRGEVDGIFTSVVHECCERVETAETEVEALSRWKAEALAVLAEWDGVYEALGSPATLGERKSTASFREVMRLREREARVRALHIADHDYWEPNGGATMTACAECGDDLPCPTLRALDGEA